MILTTCAVCAVPLTHEAPATCAKCDTRYCSATCRHSHWRSGHRGLCPEIRRAGGAEQYNANKKYKEAVAVAVKECAEDTKGQTCYICLEDGSEEGLVRSCACRGAAGVAHLSCLAKQAKILCDEAEEVDWDDESYAESWHKWTTCGLCKQDYHGVVCAALGWACWKAYVGLPEADDVRHSALSTLSRSIHNIPGTSVICIHEAHLDCVRRFMSDDEEEELLRAQTHLATAYENVGRTSEALALHREIYAKTKELVDEGEDLVHDLINTVSGLSSTLMELGRFSEARTLLHEHLTVASDSLGVDHVETLYIHLYYADSLIYEDDDHGEETDDEQDRKDYLEAERIAADVLCRAERIYGSHHPGTIYARDILKDAREELAAQERRRTLRPRPKRARTS